MPRGVKRGRLNKVGLLKSLNRLDILRVVKGSFQKLWRWRQAINKFNETYQRDAVERIEFWSEVVYVNGLQQVHIGRMN